VAAFPATVREPRFELWVRGRLSSWSSAEIQAFDRWLLDESLYEFVPAVRAALSHRRLEESAHSGREERAV
jgi:hypothetical protein